MSPSFLSSLQAAGWTWTNSRPSPRTKSGGFCHTTYVSDHDGQLWDDTLMMTVLPLAKIGLLLNRPKYVQEAKKQVLIHIKSVNALHDCSEF